MLEPEIIQWIVPAATVAAAWGGTRQALNGTRERVKSIDRKLDIHTEKQARLTERVAVIEIRAEEHAAHCHPSERGYTNE